MFSPETPVKSLLSPSPRRRRFLSWARRSVPPRALIPPHTRHVVTCPASRETQSRHETPHGRRFRGKRAQLKRDQSATKIPSGDTSSLTLAVHHGRSTKPQHSVREFTVEQSYVAFGCKRNMTPVPRLRQSAVMALLQYATTSGQATLTTPVRVFPCERINVHVLEIEATLQSPKRSEISKSLPSQTYSRVSVWASPARTEHETHHFVEALRLVLPLDFGIGFLHARRG